MERDKDLLLALIKFLLEHGYPKESLVMEWGVGKQYKVDLAVIDPDSNKAIALFELKRKKSLESMKMAFRQLKVYSKAIGDEQVPVYVVFGKYGDPPFEIYHLKKEEFGECEELKIDRVPDYSIFKNRKIRQIIDQIEKKRERTINYFQIICWIMAFFTAVLLVLDFLNILKITPERLALIGVIAGLIIVPFASKLKILGFEYEGLKKKERKD